MPPSLPTLARWLSDTLGEPHPLVRASAAPVTHLALALEPGDLPAELNADALFLHRSRGVGERWPGLGVLGAHDGFDLHLTTGPNRRLARVLGWRDVRQVEWERASGLIATPVQEDWEALRAALHRELGGEDTSFPPADPRAPRVALMNALRPGLVEQAADLGVTVYLTGQLRPSAVAAARARGVGVIALGHRRTEEWGLRQLARELGAAFPGLEVAVWARGRRQRL